ncbi:hypothetical protein LRH25_12025 [Ideonella azotifigens]|uniref:Uncharacterized protein n=1 Tax=Ideonella azotifigens TaxID=513160 RepID=A0ABN1JTU8_9BURK|nr:hypothetical protein [Ideonella azotifigens]MCD2341071.1 hypothetical protein [Ideonella azotifigens]
MPNLSREQLLSEIEDLLRTMPERSKLRHPLEENYSWFGRALALVAQWDEAQSLVLNGYINSLASPTGDLYMALAGMMTIINQARFDLRMRTTGPLSVVVGGGNVFDYFDELRKIIEEAKASLFFVDPYLDAEFVSRYAPHIKSGVSVRLLANKTIQSLLPAVQAFSQQSKLAIEVRSTAQLHDRFLFVDNANCYQSGASFKDGAKKAPTTLTQIADAFIPVRDTFEQLWKSASVHI